MAKEEFRGEAPQVEAMSWDAYWSEEDHHEWWERPAPAVLALIESLSPAERPEVLDLGCGLGRHAIAFAQAGFRVTATDAAKKAVDHLDEWAKQLGLSIRTRVCDAVEVDFPAESFDVVVAYNVLYHGYRDQFARAIAHVRKLLKPGGQLFLTCPTREDGKYGFGEELASHTFACDKSIVPGDIHYFSDETDLDELLSGFSIISRTKE
jgi:2-polyprenyl-3-methyl-5-hydroxy-6-metoxy-1,4-benzoquinol methylase